MPSLQSSLSGSQYYYTRTSHHASYNFNQSAQSLFRNQPRLPFEYYINISLNNLPATKQFISGFFDSTDLAQIMPLVKTVDMPSMKIETTPLNQYNRKRLSQSKIGFEPVKMVFHDVADGKTLKFWDMYYRYYFADGNEPGKNQEKTIQNIGGTYAPDLPAGAGQSSPLFAATDPRMAAAGTGIESSTNTNGDKSSIQNIVSDTLDNHNFGFNLPTVQNVRNLIQTIDIYQVHGGRFNQVTLVNPRVSAFTHDVLNYAVGDKTLEITFTFEYEYAYYTIQNMKLNGGEPNNNSTLEQFTHGDFLELSNLSFTQYDPDFIETNSNPANGNNVPNVGGNIQTKLDTVTETSTYSYYSYSSSSSISGLVDVNPLPSNIPTPPVIETRPFDFNPTPDSVYYPDMNRTGGNY